LLSRDVEIVGNRIKVNVFDFKEQEHPRAKGGKKGGQFVKKGSGGGSSSSKSEKPESFKGQKFLGSKLADLSEERHGNLQNKNFYNAKLDFNKTYYVKLDNSNFKKSVIKNLNDVKSAKGADFTKAKFYNDYDDYDNFEHDIKKGKFDNASFQGVDSTPLTGFGCTKEEECVVLGSKYVKFKKVRGSYDSDEEVNIDAKVSNADWLKRTWDLPPYGSKEFFEVLKQMHITLDHFKTLPVYKYYIQNKKGK